MVVAAVVPPSSSGKGVGGHNKKKPKSLLVAHLERGGKSSASNNNNRNWSITDTEQQERTAELSDEVPSCRKSIDSAFTASTASDSFWCNDSSRLSGSTTTSRREVEASSNLDGLLEPSFPEHDSISVTSTTSTGSSSVFDRLYHNRKRDKPLWKDPKSPQPIKRLVAARSPPSPAPNTTSSIFDRLHKNEKRSDTLWKDPTKRATTRSVSPTPIKRKPPVAPLSPCFERLYRNEKRTENKNPSRVPEKTSAVPLTPQRPAARSERPKWQSGKKTATASNKPLSPKKMFKPSAAAVTPDSQSSKGNATGTPTRTKAVNKMSDGPLLPVDVPTTRLVTPTHNDKKNSHAPTPPSGGTKLKVARPDASFLDDEDCFERLYHNHKRRDTVWKDKAHIIVKPKAVTVTRSLSPHRTMSKHRTPSIFSRLYHNKKRKEHVWMEPKRSVVKKARSLSPKRPRERTPSIFHRLYHNEKRPEPVWIEPKHTCLLSDGSRSRFGERQGNSESLPEVFVRLYHIERRKERVWNEPNTARKKALEKQRSRSLSPQSTTSATHNLPLNDAPNASQCDMAGEETKARRGRRMSRSTTPKFTINSVPMSPCTPVKVAQGICPLSTEEEQLIASDIHTRSCLACRERTSRGNCVSPKHTFLRASARSVTPQRRTLPHRTIERNGDSASTNLDIFGLLESELAHDAPGCPLNRTFEKNKSCKSGLQSTPDNSQPSSLADDGVHDGLPSRTLARTVVNATMSSSRACPSPRPSSRSVTPKRNNKNTTALKGLEEHVGQGAVAPLTRENMSSIPGHIVSQWSSKAFNFLKASVRGFGELRAQEEEEETTATEVKQEVASDKLGSTNHKDSEATDCDVQAKKLQPDSMFFAKPESTSSAFYGKKFEELKRETLSSQHPLQTLNVARPQRGNRIVAAIVDGYLRRVEPAVKLGAAIFIEKATSGDNDVEMDDHIDFNPTELSTQIIDWWAVPMNMAPSTSPAGFTSPYKSISTPERHAVLDDGPKKWSFGGGLASTSYSYAFPKPPISACIGWIFLDHPHGSVTQ